MPIENSLAVMRPDLAQEWDYEINESLTPDMVTCGSGKKVGWRCSEKRHRYKAKVHHRTNGSGCPYCSGRMATKENNLAVLNPKLAIEWHHTKNGSLTPYDVTVSSAKKVWWSCLNNAKHSYES